MSPKKTLWQTVVQFVRPERETYETRRTRPGDAAAAPSEQFNAQLDQRRGGGIGG